jgi:deoxyribose-phosphate aldolase
MTAIGRRAARLEHRLTRPNASLAELDAAVSLAIQHDCAAVTVNPWLVKAAKRALGRSRMRLGTMIGSPNGTQILAVKAFEASKALEQGANQIDFVLNAGALLSGEDETVFNDMLAVVDMAHSALAVAGVVVEAGPMSDDVQVKAAGRFRTLADVRAAVSAGATRVSAELSPELAAAATALFAGEPDPVVAAVGVDHTTPRPRAVASRAS